MRCRVAGTMPGRIYFFASVRSSDSGARFGSAHSGRDLTRFRGGGCLARAAIITGNTGSQSTALVPRPGTTSPRPPHPGTNHHLRVHARRPRVLGCTQYGFGCQQLLHLPVKPGAALVRRAARTRDTRVHGYARSTDNGLNTHSLRPTPHTRPTTCYLLRVTHTLTCHEST